MDPRCGSECAGDTVSAFLDITAIRSVNLWLVASTVVNSEFSSLIEGAHLGFRDTPAQLQQWTLVDELISHFCHCHLQLARQNVFYRLPGTSLT